MATTATLLTAGLRNLSQALGPSVRKERPSEAVLVPLSLDTDRIDPDAERFRFQYFPETVQSSKQTNWQQKEIPGGSLPIYQWIAGGEHLISFTASFSCDTDLLSNEQLWSKLQGDGLKERNPDIRSAVAWLRQFKLPTYAAGGNAGTPVTKAPRKLLLYMPNTGIGLLAGLPQNEGSTRKHSLYCIMTQCDITYSKFFPSGLPRRVDVALAFAQVAQYGGSIQFPAVSAVHGELLKSRWPFLPYNLRSEPIGRGVGSRDE